MEAVVRMADSPFSGHRGLALVFAMTAKALAILRHNAVRTAARALKEERAKA